ncbi:serine hydrolase [Pseudocolwellia sp. HL-MZ19]|uniref:serine hydrolase n=1 Tax=Pseudocolwellia sp. HL-MZ19 TaxID=3400846 RepID=UPI003CF523A6
MKAIFHFSSLLILLFISPSFSAHSSDKTVKVEQAITEAMQEFNIPGVAVAIVEDDHLVFSQGFGLKEYGKLEKVTSDTLFGIASNTKAMTVVLLAQLVDQYKISWQTKVVDILPEFQLYNAFVTNEFTLIDLLSHRSGLGYGAGDLMIWPARSYTEKYIFNGLKHLPQASGFRTEFAYNNLMYIIAGKIIEKITHKPWSQNLQERLFTPLGMNNSTASFSLLTSNLSNKKINIAKPHLIINEELTVVESDYLTNFSSAGSVISNVHDMALWLKVLLNQGELNKEKVGLGDQSLIKLNLGINSNIYQLYSQTQASLMWQSHISRKVTETEIEQDNTHFSAYGLGWFLKDFHGMKLVHHSGGIQGMLSKVLLIPERDLGIVILTNQQSNAAINAIYREIFEVYLDLPKNDWVAFYQQKEQRQLKRETNRLSEIEKHLIQSGSSPLTLDRYAQTYIDKWYGEIMISLENKKLRITFSQTPSLKGELFYYQDNTFIVRWDDRSLNADAYVKFSVTPDGDISEVTLKPVSYLTDFSFDFQDLKLIPKTH